MSGPWEQFQNTDAPVEDGPWNQFVPQKVANGQANPAAQTPPSPTPSESALRGAAQGSTFGFGDEISAAIGALRPTETDQALGRGYTDRYATIRDQLRADNEKAQQANPITSAVSEIIASIPTAIATGGSGSVGAAAASGGAYGLGKSNKESVGQTVKDTALSAAVSGVAAGVLNKTLSAAKQSFKSAGLSAQNVDATAVDEWGNLLQAAKPPRISRAGDEVLKINYGVGSKEAIEVGREMQAHLKDPIVKAQITTELIEQPKNIQNIIGKVQSQAGKVYDETIAGMGDVRGDVSSVFDKARKSAQGIYEKSDVSVEKVKGALISEIDSFESALVQKYGSLNDVPLPELAALKQDLGNLIFKKKAFKKPGSDEVNGVAQKFWGDLTDTVAKIDIEKGTGGKLAAIDKVFKATYRMEDSIPSGADLLGLTNPKGVTAAANFDDFLSNWAAVPAEIRKVYGDELSTYLKGDLAKVIQKAQIMQAVDKASTQGINVFGVSIPLPNQAGRIDYANRLGSLLGPKKQTTPSGLEGLSSGLPKARRMVAPAVGALTTQSEPPTGRGSLDDLNN